MRKALFACPMALVAMVLCAPLAAASGVQANQAVTDVSFTPSTTAGGASGVAWSLRFTATDALIGGSSTVSVSAPSGTSFAGVNSVLAVDLRSGQALEAGSCQTRNRATTITCTVGHSVAAGDVVSYDVELVSNPAPGAAFSGISISTSSDDDQVAVPSGASFTPPQPVSDLSFTPSTAAAGATHATWSFAFTTSSTGDLTGSGSTITVHAPSGTSFLHASVLAYDVTTGDQLFGSPRVIDNGATLIYRSEDPARPGDRLSLAVSGVTNPAPGTAVSGVAISTSSDDVGTRVPSDASFTPAQPVAGLSFTPSTTAAGATDATWSFAFTTSSTGDLTDSGSTITVHAPSGTSFLHASVLAYDVTTGEYLLGTSSGDGASVTYTVGFRVRAGDEVLYSVQGVRNPASGVAFSGISISTSADPVPVPVASDAAFAPAATVGRVAVEVSSGVADANDQLTYTTTTSDTGALSADSGTITLVAPQSTVFGSDAADYTVNGTPVTAAPRVTGDDEVTLTVPSAVAAGSALQVVATSVINPASDAYPATSFSLSTSADPTSISPPVGIDFTSTATATAVDDVSFAPSTTAGGALGATWSVSFTASGTGGFSQSGTVRLVAPPGADFTGGGGCIALDLTSGDGGGCPESSSHGGTTTTISPQLTVDPGDRVAIIVSGIRNPSPGTPESGLTVSTSSDTAPAAASGAAAFTGASRPSGVTFAPSTTAVGATMVTWATTLTTSSTGALMGFDTVKLVAPAGTSFTGSDRCEAFDLSSGEEAGCVYKLSTGGNIASVIEPITTSAGDQIAIVLAGITNPASRAPESGLTVSSSSDRLQARPSTGARFTPAQGPTQVTFAAEPATPKASATWWTTLTTSSTGALLNQSTVTLNGPSGAKFPDVTGCEAWDLTSGEYRDCSLVAATSGATVTVTPELTTAPGDQVAILLSSVINPPTAPSVTVATSSDPIAAEPGT